MCEKGEGKAHSGQWVCVCEGEGKCAGNVSEWSESASERGCRYLHSVKVDNLSTTGTTPNILNLVCLKSGLGREKG